MPGKGVAHHRYTLAQRAEAVALSRATTIQEAAKRTGIPDGTIKAWRVRAWTAANPLAPAEASGALETLSAIAQEQALATTRDYLVERLHKFVDELSALAQNAITHAKTALEKEPHNRDGAAWLRAVVGVFAQSVEKILLLSGKPTVRTEVLERREYQIAHRIVGEYPQIIDAIWSDGPGLEGGSGEGKPLSLGALCGSDLPLAGTLPIVSRVPAPSSEGDPEAADGDDATEARESISS